MMYSQDILSCSLPELETLLKFSAVGGVTRLNWMVLISKKKLFKTIKSDYRF